MANDALTVEKNGIWCLLEVFIDGIGLNFKACLKYWQKMWISFSNWIFLEGLESKWSVPVSEICLRLVFFWITPGNVA